MKNSTGNEALRLSIQAELDAKKTSLERNKLGQFATPTVLAREILSYGLSLIPADCSVRFIDPAIGTGSFYSALRETLGDRVLGVAKGYEVDPHYGEPARDLWANCGLDIEIADFTKIKPPSDGFNLLICNPPYVRHHHLDGTEKKRLQAESKKSAGVKLSGLAGLYCHFLAISHQWMSADGIAGWLIPSEFMDVNYGREVKRYLLEDVTLLSIHRFDPNDVQFDDALVSSAVVWFKKSKPPEGHTVEFSYGGTHSEPAISRRISSTELLNEAKWTRFPKQEVREVSDTPILSDFFSIKRGIATGSNDFFILSKDKIIELGLPMEFFRPILPSPRYVKADEIEADEQGNPILPESLFLLDCRLPEDEIKAKYPSLWHYLESGKEEIASRYLCKSRPIWYKQEDRSYTPFVCTYMGRSDSGSGSPFRFLLNHSQAIVANTYLMLYPKPGVAERLNNRPDVIRKIWKSLKNIRPESMMSEGRVYGGGLHKMEPNELAKVSASEISELLSES
ncbi:Eco57I restriction-modification methylase domain-containing protein [Methylomonas rosea]|uniref:site-specific DNA-methyltransferase (adenine-specific) n=1 Tax=Methylomonas rosea TaxID=2952227 RepID=A0ABT1TUS4_9GAMM|nr:Eco57I restriction-modification methylase domain-containing protein [Methylomonas sp. WSC-7]MCQ8118524.1 Eco57I restriction-modification methylase domain-containing protein [Methylomonas sp. WSC-7]